MYTVKKLKYLRKENHITVVEMAKRLNISPAHYCLIENMKRNLYYEMAVKIAKVFNMKPDELFYIKSV